MISHIYSTFHDYLFLLDILVAQIRSFCICFLSLSVSFFVTLSLYLSRYLPRAHCRACSSSSSSLTKGVLPVMRRQTPQVICTSCGVVVTGWRESTWLTGFSFLSLFSLCISSRFLSIVHINPAHNSGSDMWGNHYFEYFLQSATNILPRLQ